MKYYIEDANGRVVGKFDGVTVDTKDGHERVAVDSLFELSGVTVDAWDEDYLK